MQPLKKTHKYIDGKTDRGANINTLLLLIYISIIIFFIPLVIQLLYSKQTYAISVPVFLNMAIIILITSNWLLHLARHFRKTEDVLKLKLTLAGAFAMGVLFLFLQYKGWMDIYLLLPQADIKILMVMVAVHALHFLIAMLILGVIFLQLIRARNAAELYIFFLNPKKETTFYIFNSYWNFLNVLWILLYSIMLLKMF